jgi:hypothetical protein
MHQSMRQLEREENSRLGEDSKVIYGTVSKPDGLGRFSGSCVSCDEEQTPQLIMSRCAKCKLVRCAGVQCNNPSFLTAMPADIAGSGHNCVSRQNY